VYQPVFVNELNCADVRRHAAYILLLARFPRALSRRQFLFPGECLICRSPQTGMLFFWAKQNSYYTTEMEAHTSHVMIWRFATDSRDIVPYFFEEKSQKSRNFVILELTNRGNMELAWSQQDSALAYFNLNVREFMNEAFPDRWVFRGSAAFPSTMSRPPCNPDLTTADSSLWGIIKHKLAVRRSTPTTKLTSGHY